MEYVSYLGNTICNYGIMTKECNLSDINETVSLYAVVVGLRILGWGGTAI